MWMHCALLPLHTPSKWGARCERGLEVLVVVHEVCDLAAVVAVHHAGVVGGHGGHTLDFDGAAVGVRSESEFNATFQLNSCSCLISASANIHCWCSKPHPVLLESSALLLALLRSSEVLLVGQLFSMRLSLSSGTSSITLIMAFSSSSSAISQELSRLTPE